MKTFAANGVYGMACVTAWTVQSTQGVRRVQAVDAGLILETLDCLASDVQFSAIKTGMLGDHRVAAAVLDWLRRHPAVPVILDPVFQSSSGACLLDAKGLAGIREEWLGRVQWITPNWMELATLTGVTQPFTRAEIESAAVHLHLMAARLGNPGINIAVTGGHAQKPDDLLLTAGELQWYPGEHIETASTHGTGCAFSSALAARVAWGEKEEAAMQSAKEYVAGALREAYTVGQGKGPLNHFWPTDF